MYICTSKNNIEAAYDGRECRLQFYCEIIQYSSEGSFVAWIKRAQYRLQFQCDQLINLSKIKYMSLCN